MTVLQCESHFVLLSLVLFQIVAITITQQIRLLFNSILICGAFWLIFAIMGVQMFAGKFYEVSQFLETWNLNLIFVSHHKMYLHLSTQHLSMLEFRVRPIYAFLF